MTKRLQELDLEQAITFLLARAGARVSNAFGQVVKPYGLSVTEWRVCASLLRTSDQTLSELAEHVAIDVSALSRIIDRLSERRLVRRKRSTNDKRAVLVALSAKGIGLASTLVPLAREHEAAALADFDAGEARMLRDLLQRLYRESPPAA